MVGAPGLTRLLAERAQKIYRFGKWWFCARSTRAIGVSPGTPPEMHRRPEAVKGEGMTRTVWGTPAAPPAAHSGRRNEG